MSVIELRISSTRYHCDWPWLSHEPGPFVWARSKRAAASFSKFHCCIRTASSKTRATSPIGNPNAAGDVALFCALREFHLFSYVSWCSSRVRLWRPAPRSPGLARKKLPLRFICGRALIVSHLAACIRSFSKCTCMSFIPCPHVG